MDIERIGEAMNERWDAWTAPACARTGIGAVQPFSADALLEITVAAAR